MIACTAFSERTATFVLAMSNTAPAPTVTAVAFAKRPTSLMRIVPRFTVRVPAVACARSGMCRV